MSGLTAAQRTELDATAVPMESGLPVAACVVEGPRTAWMHDGGRHKEPFGPVYPTVRAAAAAARHLNLRSFGPAS